MDKTFLMLLKLALLAHVNQDWSSTITTDQSTTNLEISLTLISLKISWHLDSGKSGTSDRLI